MFGLKESFIQQLQAKYREPLFFDFLTLPFLPSTAVGKGLGLKGLTSNMPAPIRNLPGFSANTLTRSDDIACEAESSSTRVCKCCSR